MYFYNYFTLHLDTNGGRKRVSIRTDQRELSRSKILKIGGKKTAIEVENRQHTTLENLAPFSNYSIMISAETEEGEGPYSRPIYCSTQRLGKSYICSHHMNNLIIID
jgi:hypothetical protein